MQRAYTGSQFDHVGMCVKFDQEDADDIFILESTGNYGVHFVRFSNMAKHAGTFFKKIVVRNLKFERDTEMLEKLS